MRLEVQGDDKKLQEICHKYNEDVIMAELRDKYINSQKKKDKSPAVNS